MDPITQILAQQQSGSANGEGFGQFYVEGQRQGLARRRLELEEKQDARTQQRFDMMLPLEKSISENQLRNLGAIAQNNELDFQIKTLQNTYVPEINNLLIRFMTSPAGMKDQSLIREAEDLRAHNPAIFAPGMPGAKLFDQILAVPMMEADQARKLEMIKRIGGGRNVDSYNPTTGLVNFETPRAIPDKLEIANEMGRLQSLASGVPVTPEQQLSNIQSQLAGTTTELFDRDTGQLIMRTGTGKPGASGMPTTVVADAERKATGAVDAVHFANDVIRYATTRNVGLLGNLNRLGSQVLGQVIDVKPGDEFKYAQAAGALKAAAIKVLRSDSNITETERRSIEATLPSIGPNESDESAREKARNIAYIIASSAKRQLERAGQPLPRELMSQAELMQLMRENKLTAREAATLWSESPFNR